MVNMTWGDSNKHEEVIWNNWINYVADAFVMPINKLAFYFVTLHFVFITIIIVS